MLPKAIQNKLFYPDQSEFNFWNQDFAFSNSKLGKLVKGF